VIYLNSPFAHRLATLIEIDCASRQGASEPSGEKSELIVRRLIDYLYKLAGASVSSDTDIRMRDGLSALALLSHESPKDETARNADGTPYGGILDGVAHESPKEQA